MLHRFFQFLTFVVDQYRHENRIPADRMYPVFKGGNVFYMYFQTWGGTCSDRLSVFKRSDLDFTIFFERDVIEAHAKPFGDLLYQRMVEHAATLEVPVKEGLFGELLGQYRRVHPQARTVRLGSRKNSIITRRHDCDIAFVSDDNKNHGPFYTTANHTLAFADRDTDFKTMFDLYRIKMDVVVELQDGTCVHAPSEYYDVSIPLLGDDTIKDTFGHDWTTFLDGVRVPSLQYMIQHDLFPILFVQSKYPWTAPKYEKRVIRMLAACVCHDLETAARREDEHHKIVVQLLQTVTRAYLVLMQLGTVVLMGVQGSSRVKESIASTHALIRGQNLPEHWDTMLRNVTNACAVAVSHGDAEDAYQFQNLLFNAVSEVSVYCQCIIDGGVAPHHQRRNVAR